MTFGRHGHLRAKRSWRRALDAYNCNQSGSTSLRPHGGIWRSGTLDFSRGCSWSDCRASWPRSWIRNPGGRFPSELRSRIHLGGSASARGRSGGGRVAGNVEHEPECRPVPHCRRLGGNRWCVPSRWSALGGGRMDVSCGLSLPQGSAPAVLLPTHSVAKSHICANSRNIKVDHLSTS